MKEILSENGFLLKKKFGQNFIIDENIIQAIVNKAGVDAHTTVLEIGPGAGSLTYHLSQSAKEVICYEIDETLKPILTTVLKEKENVTIYYEDFLLRDVWTDLLQCSAPISLVANLPYYITTPIVMKVIEDNLPIERMVIMVQKEVGDRFKATPGNKEYGSLSVFLNYYFAVKKIMDISANVFIPKPNVDSIVLLLERKKNIDKVANEELFFQLIKDSFRQKRKTLKNNLKDYELDKIETVLKEHHLDLSVRAEMLPLSIFIEMANTLI